jgi:acyl carrier protein
MLIEAEKTFQTVRQIVSDVLEVPPEQVTPTCSPENLSSWDSVRHLNVILALEAEFGIQFDAGEMDRTNSVGQILDLLQSKLASRTQN